MISRNKQPRLLARVEQYIGHLTSAKADYKARPSFSVPCNPGNSDGQQLRVASVHSDRNSIGMGMAKRLNAYLEQRRILINDVIRRSGFSTYCVSWLFRPRTGNSRRELSEGGAAEQAALHSAESSSSVTPILGGLHHKHSRRALPINRSQNAFAWGDRYGVFNTLNPNVRSEESTSVE